MLTHFEVALLSAEGTAGDSLGCKSQVFGSETIIVPAAIDRLGGLWRLGRWDHDRHYFLGFASQEITCRRARDFRIPQLQKAFARDHFPSLTIRIVVIAMRSANQRNRLIQQPEKLVEQ